MNEPGSGPPSGSSYEAAGVSLERGDEATSMMRASVESTHGPAVLPNAGGFAGLYALSGYRDPVLASTVDGVGTKVLVAGTVGRYDTLGADIVNHCANDVLATGADPLVFLDYVASGRLDPAVVAEVVRGAAEACRSLGVSLVGGETAEMPGLYVGGDMDIVGVCVGACERERVVTGEGVEVGDVLIGLPSSGLHTNGYTLARKVLEDAGLSYDRVPEGWGEAVGEAFLEPHRAYLREVSALGGSVVVRGMAHVTGGGLPGNLPRALGGKGARLYAGSWEEPAVFGLIRALGDIGEEEMRRVFNLGVGFCVVVGEEEAGPALEMLRGVGCDARRIGEVVADEGVEFVPGV